MQTIIRNSDSVAVYVGNALNLTAQGLRGPDWIDPSLTTSTATVVDVPLPGDFLPGAYAYIDEAWVVADQSILDAHNAEVAAQLLAAITQAVIRIDATADAIYAAALGNRATEYAEAEAQATEYKTAGYTGTVPAYVQAWATATGKTAQWAADDILATAATWRTAQTAIRAQRLICKQHAKAATTQSALDAVAVQWGAFVAQVKVQLGAL